MRSRLSDELRNKVAGKRLVFTVTTGRSGTHFLSELGRRMPGVDCYHEPWPNFVTVLRRIQSEPGLAKRFWVESKLPAIARKTQPTYFEAGHLFCKGFLEPLLELGFLPDLVLLTRPPRSVATSMLQLDTIPGRTVSGDTWYLRPDDPGVLKLRNWQELTDYQLCYWQSLEIARRQTEYSKLVTSRGARVLKLDFADLRAARGVLELSSFLTRKTLLPRPLLHVLLARASNQKSSSKQRPPPEDQEQQEVEVRGRIAAEGSHR